MNGNDKCYKCTKRKIGCHDRCPDYKMKDYEKEFNQAQQDFEHYLVQAKLRMKYSKNLFKRGIRNE